MASTSLAEQLRKLAAPHTSKLVQKKKKTSLLFTPNEAASIDRSTFYEIGLGGLNELIKINPVFEEFTNSLFDETSKNFERTVESAEVNEKLNRIIKKFLYSLSPYFLLKPTQKVLEWLIVRFYIHEYNVDELLCSALPYHGTRLFARLIQVLDLKNSNEKWQWLYPLQKKGVPLSKNALFNHCASDMACLKMMCEATIEATEIFGCNASKLTTLFGFYTTTIVGAVQSMSKITELHLTHILNSIYYGLSSDCVDFTASVLIVIATILTKASFQERLHKKIVERVTKVKHSSLHSSVITLLNILYQSENPDLVTVPQKAIKNILKNSAWFTPSLAEFMSSGNHPNVFFTVLIRDSLKLLQTENNEEEMLQPFIRNLLISCRANDVCAEKLIHFIINEVKDNADQWSCELVQGLERQYPSVWDNVISSLFKEYPSESLSPILGLTSITSQVQVFEKLNHVNTVVRMEAIKYISKNPHSIKMKYIKSSLDARWRDDDPQVIETMFSLPKELASCSTEIIDKLLLKCWLALDNEWDPLLLKIINFLNDEVELAKNPAKFTVMLLPFLFSNKSDVIESVLNINLPFFKSLNGKKKSNSIIPYGMIMNCPLPSVEAFIAAYEELPKENVYTVTFLLLFSCLYASSTAENKCTILSFVSKEILEPNFKKFKWKPILEWNDDVLEHYFTKTKKGKFPREIVYTFFSTAVKFTSIPQDFTAVGWWDFLEEQSALIASLYMHLSVRFQCSEEVENSLAASFVKKHFKTLASKIQFLCNMCLVHKHDSSVTICTFKLMNNLLKNSNESYSWALALKQENIVVPCILIFLYSNERELRSVVMDMIEIVTISLSSALTSEVTYSELFKYLLNYKSEIILDKEQLPLTMYAFLSQDDDVESLLPVTVRCLTKIISDGLIGTLTHEKTPLNVSASLIVILEYLKDLTIIEKLVSFCERIIKFSNYPNDDASSILKNVIDKFHANDMKIYKNSKIREFLIYCLRNGDKIKVRATNGVSCLTTLVLRKFSIDIFDKMDENLKEIFLNVVFNISSDCDDVDLLSAANSFAKKITLECKMLIPYLEDMKNVGVEKKGKAKSLERLPDILKTAEWKRGIALLELVQNKKKIYNCHLILPLLFEILQKCCELDDQLTVEYVKQVCLSCALNCSQKLISENRSDIEKLFNVELVVNCIRMSPNPQTHHHALLLLAHCATYTPNRVLHNIMAIFTFMGSSILRQDDAFSFQIISNILETIVPLLVKTNDANQLSASSIASVLKVFATSLPDIPDHRRIPLLVKLMNILEDGKYLHVLIILTLECCAKNLVNNKSVGTKYTEIMLELCLLLPVQVLLSCFKKLLTFMNTLPMSTEEKQVGCQLPFLGQLLDLKKYSKKELCHFNYIMLNFISTVLSDVKFISQVTRLKEHEFKSLEYYFKGIIEQILLYVKSVTEFSANSKNTSSKYWKVIISQSMEILNKTNALLTNETFLSVVKELLSHDCLTVQRKTLEILNWRLQQSRENASRENFSSDELISLIYPLMEIIDAISHSTYAEVFDQKLNQQIALISLKLITRYCGAANYPEIFKMILSKLTDVWNVNSKLNDQVLACLVLCIAELTSSLKIHGIEFLPQFMPTFLRLFKRFQTEEIAQSDVILLSIITALQKVIEIIPNFLSPYLETILFEVCCLTERIHKNDDIKQKKSEDTKLSNVSHKLKLIRQKISSEIPSRVLLPSVSSCFARLIESTNFNVIKHLLDILAESFPTNGQFSIELTNLFLSILDFRCTSGTSEEVICLVEGYVIDSLCKIVLKCSESTFRPFYHKLYDWGVIASKDISKKYRIITYYRLLSLMSEKLKSIFVLFASNIMRNATELLDKNNICKCENDVQNLYFSSDIDKTVMLVDSILITLCNVFKYDTIKFLTKERFEMLVEPLVNQVENTIGDYEKRSTDIIAPCVSRFAAATSDDSLWKQFNYLILLKTRHSSYEVRLTALEIVCLFATQLGDNFLPFLPETVPFLAELLEDENEIVEKKTHKAVQKLEKILDEPIQKYF